VTIWAASTTAADGRVTRAGFTVGSTTVADGAPSSVLGLWTEVADSGRFTVNVLQWADRNLADVFAGLAPAPGGMFATDDWQDTPHGPVLGRRTWAGCRLVDSRVVGYALLVTGAIEEVVVAPGESDAGLGGEPEALARLLGRYTAVPAPRR
jgi:hypothetical protein